MRELSRCTPIILYLDSTGSVIRKQKEQKEMYYHCMVFQKENTGLPPLPAIEMLTRENYNHYIKIMISQLMLSFRKVVNKELHVKYVVTDQS
jgi:hypothetical protein